MKRGNKVRIKQILYPSIYENITIGMTGTVIRAGCKLVTVKLDNLPVDTPDCFKEWSWFLPDELEVI